ncbi:MAG: transposase family protein [Thioploca sp.]|nr:transposase family protein [Thioploca sp.]
MVLEWLKHWLGLPHGISSDDTYRWVFSQLKPMAFKQAFRAGIPTLMTNLRVMSFPLMANV